MHTSPLAQPGTGDGGGMNVYVRELSSALARSGVRCEVFTRADDLGQPSVIAVEPGFRVHHVPAGPVGPVPKEALADLVEDWTAGVDRRLRQLADLEGAAVDAIHANYWLSGLAGHTLKHELDVPLVSTFHTLDRVKAEASPEELSSAEPARRARAEADIVGCSDLVLASCTVEAEQLVQHYGAEPDRVEIVAPAVDHAFFGPGQQAQARRAVGLPGDCPILLFVGRIQPLKGLAVAVEALARVVESGVEGPSTAKRPADARLVVIGGPSGPHGLSELANVRSRLARLGLEGRVHMVPAQRHEVLSTYYRAADVCVVPSRSESFGMVALEAGACGVPVVASGVGGLTTLVDHGRTGYLVDDRDPDMFAAFVVALLTDPDHAEAVGRGAAARAARYTWADAAGRLHRRLDELTARELVACR
jgi:D-inositol-3-phosphate glycosyltransferase